MADFRCDRHEPRLAPLCCLSAYRDWSTLAPPVLDNLAAVLKRIRRWRLDGPKLRCLNKHWCDVMNSNVQEVRPHPLRRIGRTDVSSLLKFSRLTSLDISPFVEFRTDVDANGHVEAPSTTPAVDLYAQKVECVARVLGQLRHLREIELHCLTVFRTFSDSGESLRHFSRLTATTSLCMYSSVNPKLYGEDVLSPPMIGRGPLCSIRQLEEFVQEFPKLKSLEAHGTLTPSNASLPPSLFKKLESVKLCGLNTVQWTRKKPRPTSLVTSLRLFSPSLEELPPLRATKHLEELSLSISDGRTLMDGLLTHVFKSLKSLTVRNGGSDYLRIPDTLFDAFPKVQRLSFTKFAFCGKEMRGNGLFNVKALKFADCRVTDGDMSFLSKARLLESLSLQRGLRGNIDELEVVTHAKNLKHLNSLFVGLINDIQTVRAIAQLSTVEVLGLCIHSETALHGLRDLDQLLNLRVLGLSHCLGTDLCPTLLSLDLLGRLEKLFLDQVCMCHVLYEDMLNKRSLGLILEDRRVDFHRFAASNFF